MTLATAFLWGYLLIGIACVVLLVMMLKSTDPDMTRTLAQFDQTVSTIPGGMVTVLTGLTLLWPAVLLYMASNTKKRG